MKLQMLFSRDVQLNSVVSDCKEKHFPSHRQGCEGKMLLSEILSLSAGHVMTSWVSLQFQTDDTSHDGIVDECILDGKS